MLQVQDYDGVIPVDFIRGYFEKYISETPTFARQFDLMPIVEEGRLLGYRDDGTHRMWVGFATGIRCAERLANAGQFPVDIVDTVDDEDE